MSATAQSRRDVIRAALALTTALAIPTAMAAAPTIPPSGSWERLCWQCGNWGGPHLQLALRHARAAGMKVDDLAAINFPSRSSAFVTFYDEEEDELHSFDADGVRGWHS